MASFFRERHQRGASGNPRRPGPATDQGHGGSGEGQPTRYARSAGDEAHPKDAPHATALKFP
jgi:hypothetical protein